MIRPVSGNYVVLSDDAPEITENGVTVQTSGWRTNLDFYVVRGGGEGFGTGDRVILDDPMCGRRIMLDGVPLRVVETGHVIAVASDEPSVSP